MSGSLFTLSNHLRRGGGVRAIIILITQGGRAFQIWAKVDYVICACSLICLYIKTFKKEREQDVNTGVT